jgi:hypothetical protein
MEGQCPMKQDKKISRVSNHDDWNKEEKKQVKDWGVAFKLDDCNAGTNPYFSSVQAASASMFLVVNHSRLCSLPKYCRRWRRMD